MLQDDCMDGVLLLASNSSFSISLHSAPFTFSLQIQYLHDVMSWVVCSLYLPFVSGS